MRLSKKDKNFAPTSVDEKNKKNHRIGINENENSDFFKIQVSSKIWY